MKRLRNFRHLAAFLILAFSFAAPLTVQGQTSEEFDEYQVRFDAAWFHSNPSGSIQGSTDAVPVDFTKDIGFMSYSTFSGKLDWKFTHKNRFTVAIIPLYSSQQKVLNRTFTFQGTTFQAGFAANSYLHVFLVAPGYQRDIIRRRRGHLGVGAQVDLLNLKARISATGSLNSAQVTRSASASLLAPLPVLGVDGRWYLTDSPRVYVQGNVYGMYFFGYGRFISTADSLGVSVTKHITLNAGFQIGTNTRVNNKGNANNENSRVEILLRQQGPIVGVECSF